MARIISVESLREERRKGTFTENIPFVVQGELLTVEKKIVNGEMETYSLSKPMGEMLTSGSLDGFKDLTRKVVLDVELGREQVPVLYKSIYEPLIDPNLPRVIDAKWALQGSVVFTEHMEGQEVKFGTLSVEHGPMARILTYTAGFEYTKEIKDFNDSFSVELLNKAMGEAYNALLNHIHLSPIFTFDYKAANKTAAQGSADEDLWVRYYKTLNKGLSDSRTKKRPGTILLASSVNKDNIEMALKGGYTIKGTTYPAVSGIEAVIYYDGWSVDVGKKHFSYDGVPENKVYLIRPRRGFKELVKRDLMIESGRGDLSRLVESQIVGHAYRGVYAAIEENVQEITLPSAN